MDLQLDDKTVLVTGSSRGIGLAIARSFARENGRVAITGRDKAALDVALEELSEYGEKVQAFEGDLTRSEIIEQVVSDVQSRWGDIDCLVANIGSGTARGGWDLEEADWQGVFEINFQGAVRMAQAVLRGMTARGGGSIVFVGSIVGLESLSAPLTYSAAKAALHNYAVNLARQVAKDGIRVNCVAPGNVLFPGGSWERKLEERREFFEDYIRREVPMGRFGTPEEIADAVTYLSSPRASFITGSVLVADGGQTRSY